MHEPDSDRSVPTGQGSYLNNASGDDMSFDCPATVIITEKEPAPGGTLHNIWENDEFDKDSISDSSVQGRLLMVTFV